MSRDRRGESPRATTGGPQRVAPTPIGKTTLTQLLLEPAPPLSHLGVGSHAVGESAAGQSLAARPSVDISALFGRLGTAGGAPVQCKAASPLSAFDDDAKVLENQASLKSTDVEIPALEGALLSTRLEAVKQGLLSQQAFDASLDLSKAMTQLQPTAVARGAIDVGLQEQAALAAQLLFMALQRETADDKNFHAVPTMGLGGEAGITEQNPYTEQVRVTTTFLFWSRTHESAGWLAQLPGLIRQHEWEDEVPTLAEAARVTKMLSKLGISNIAIRVVRP